MQKPKKTATTKAIAKKNAGNNLPDNEVDLKTKRKFVDDDDDFDEPLEDLDYDAIDPDDEDDY
jgi:hypothetical protein